MPLTQSAKAQDQFKSEIDSAISRHRFPWEHGYKSVKPAGVTNTPGEAHHSTAPSASHVSHSVADARPRSEGSPLSLGSRVKHPAHRNELSKLWHIYAINHSASPYTSVEHQHNANIYHHVSGKFGKQTADDMHRHAEAMRSSGTYTLRNKYHIDEKVQSAADVWHEHELRYGAHGEHANRYITKHLESYVASKHGEKAAQDMIAHSAMGVLQRAGEPGAESVRANLRKANHIDQWLHEAETKHYFAMADKTLHPGKQEGTAGEVFSSNPHRSAASVGHLRKLMNNPILAKSASRVVTKHAQDKRLLDMLDHFARHAPDADVRPIIKQFLRKHNVRH